MILYFLKRKLFIYFLKRKLFFYFRKWNPVPFSPRIKNFTSRKLPILQETEAPGKLLIFSRKKDFLIFQEKGTPKRKL